MKKFAHNPKNKRGCGIQASLAATSSRKNRTKNMTPEQALSGTEAENFEQSVLRQLKVLQEQLQALQTDVESTRDLQIDQERERHTLLLSGGLIGRGTMPAREPNLTISGARFKTTKKDYRPASIY